MAVFSGKAGNVLQGATDIAHITRWTMDRTVNDGVHATSDTSGHKTRVAGTADVTGTIEGKVDDAAAAGLTVGTSYTLNLYINATKYWVVPALITSYGVNVDIDTGDPVSFTANFGATAAPTAPTF